MDDLDKLLKDAAGITAVPDPLMARILADATREQPRPMRAPAQMPRSSIWSGRMAMPPRPSFSNSSPP